MSLGDVKNKSRAYELVEEPDGKIVGVPFTREEEPEPTPAEDGKYYLSEGRKAVELALRLAEEGVEVYCATCKAPLKVTRSFVLCTRNERHFWTSMHRKP